MPNVTDDRYAIVGLFIGLWWSGDLGDETTQSAVTGLSAAAPYVE